MESSNSSNISNSNPIINRFILYVFLFVLLLSLSLIVFYVYRTHTSLDNKKNNQSYIGNPILKEGIIGENYLALIPIFLYGDDLEINANVISGMPDGLQIGKCNVSNNDTHKKKLSDGIAVVCIIEGIPTTVGDYVINVEFQDSKQNLILSKEFTLSITNP